MSDTNTNTNGNGGGGGGTTVKGGTTFGTKIAYIGTGIVIGVIIYPFVRRALSTLQPRMDKIVDDFTGKAENLAETASDLFAKAKHSFSQRNNESEPTAKPVHDHTHDDGHDHSHGDKPV